MKSRLVILRLLVVILALFTLSAGAQTAKTFEVASIRPTEPGTPSRPTSAVRGSHFDLVSDIPLNIIARAFGMPQLSRIVGPDWARSQRFDIRAVMPEGSSERDVPEMLKSLLVERFQLQLHVEQRPFPSYELVIAPSGHKLTEIPPADDLRKEFPVRAGEAIPPLIMTDPRGGKVDLADRLEGLPGDEQRTITRIDGDSTRTITVTARTLYAVNVAPPPNMVRRLDATRITMGEFVRLVAGSMDRPVVDKTGLTGIYQFKTILPPLRISAAMQSVLANRVETGPSGVSINRSLEELGLRLEPNEAPADFLVIDRLERPRNE